MSDTNRLWHPTAFVASHLGNVEHRREPASLRGNIDAPARKAAQI
jgi:hypothetical protein